MSKSKGKDLVAIIKANPGCIAVVDNDLLDALQTGIRGDGRRRGL